MFYHEILLLEMVALMVGCKKYKIQYELKQEIKTIITANLRRVQKFQQKIKFIFSIQILFTTQL